MNKSKEIAELKELLSDWKWRITSWRLYKIKNKAGQVVPFIPNPYQLDLINNLSYKNLVLKARQLWFSTMIQILMLDQALFRNNIACWVIAQGLNEAKSIFNNKIRFAYNNLPEWLKEHRPLARDSADTLEFNNGSSIYVWTSFRWGTLQYIHISEYGKICAKYPERAKEINTWALEAVWAWNYVFIESTAEGKSGDFYDKTMKAMRLASEGKVLNEHEYKFFFYAWWEVEEYRLPDPYLTLTQETLKYFEELESEYWIICDEQQKKWYQVKQEEKHDDMLREYPSTPEEAFKVAIAWSYYKKRINIALKSNRLSGLPYEPSLPVHLWMDIWWAWWGDDMTVWFFQVFGKEYRFIDYWEGTGFSMQDLHAEVLMDKTYKWGTMFMPHDAKVHSQNDWKTREETMKELWYKVKVLERWAISDRIQAVRDNFKYCYFDKANCSTALDKLGEYRRKWNESIWGFTDQPDHANSHCADWFGYSMIWIQEIVKKDKPINTGPPPAFFNRMTGKMQWPWMGNNRFWL